VARDSVDEGARPFTLYRVVEEGDEQVVGTFADFAQGWAAGTSLTHAEPGASFRLYREGVSVARFGASRLAKRTDGAALLALGLL
jgi:hypothetical protein